MPSYEFACPKCGLRFEKSLTIAEYESNRPRCLDCRARVKRVLFAPAVHTRLSLMHPRHMRGQRGYKPQKGTVLN